MSVRAGGSERGRHAERVLETHRVAYEHANLSEQLDGAQRAAANRFQRELVEAVFACGLVAEDHFRLRCALFVRVECHFVLFLAVSWHV